MRVFRVVELVAPDIHRARGVERIESRDGTGKLERHPDSI